MSIEKVLYRAQAHVTGGREGTGVSSDGNLNVKLDVYKRQGLVSTRRQGKYVYYQLASFEVNQVMKTLSSLYCGRAMAALAS